MELAELHARRDQIQRDMAGPFWQELRSIFYGLLMGRRAALTNPVTGLDSAIEIAKVQAEIGAFQLVMAAPDLMLADVQRDIELALEKDREEQEAQNGG